MVSVIQLDKLSKIYGTGEQAVHAVNDLSLTVETGQIFGFLGANGAGKTTTIRMLLGLIYPSSGEASLFGQSLQDAGQVRQERVGGLVEEATLYPFMTGYNNLKAIAYTSGVTERKRIDEVLDIVGMRSFAKRKAKTYSTGMKQRLGIATALLTDPDLLILDEPTNGLDPQGIQDVRVLLQHLAQNEGKTIFLSSHLLHEIEQTCTHVAIIRNGHLVRQGAINDLLQTNSVTRLTVDDISTAYALLSQNYPTEIVNQSIEVTVIYDNIPDLIQYLVSQNIRIFEVTQKQQSLEDLFFEVTHD
ncbi:MAG: ABC transporter ATP-binding protein [Chloroflexota bacterium]